MSKRAEGLSFSVIVMAAVALLILIVLTVIVLRGGEHWNTGRKTCPSGGLCAIDSTCNGYQTSVPMECKSALVPAGKFCCLGKES